MLVDNSYQALCEIEDTTITAESKSMQLENRDYFPPDLRNLRECRKFLRFKHFEMATMLGIPQSTYASYESGARKTPSEVLEQARLFAIQNGRPGPHAAESPLPEIPVMKQGPVTDVSADAIEEAVLFVDEILASRRLVATDLRRKAKLVRLIAEELSEEAQKGTQGNLKEIIRERFGKIVEIALG